MQRAVPAAIALLVTASVLITRQSGHPATQLRCKPAAEIWIIRHGEKAANASRTLDPQRRPLTYVTNRDVANDLAASHVDLLCVNRYYGWYTDGGSAYVPKAEQPPASFFLPTPPAAIASAATCQSCNVACQLFSAARQPSGGGG